MAEIKTMRVVDSVCTKCQSSVELDLGEMTLEEAKVSVTKGMYNCIPGRHVELGPMSNYLEINWSSLRLKKDDRLTDEEYGKDLAVKHGVDNVFALGSDELTAKVGVKSLHSVGDLRHLGYGEFADEKFSYSRYDSPGGSRFYVRSPR